MTHLLFWHSTVNLIPKKRTHTFTSGSLSIHWYYQCFFFCFVLFCFGLVFFWFLNEEKSEEIEEDKNDEEKIMRLLLLLMLLLKMAMIFWWFYARKHCPIWQTFTSNLSIYELFIILTWTNMMYQELWHFYNLFPTTHQHSGAKYICMK